MKNTPSHSTYYSIYQSYVDGLNYWANTHYLPIEYHLVGMKFKNFTIIDSLAIKRLFVFGMITDYNNELVHQIIHEYISDDFLKILYKDTLRDAPFNNYTIIKEDELLNMIK